MTEARWTLLAELAARDLWFDRKVSLCIMASLVAVIAPLLLLFGLKNGVVTQLRDELRRDPRNLEIRLLGNGDMPPTLLEALRTHPATGFVIPLTRTLNTQADLVKGGAHFVADAEIIPSAAGDPLLQGRAAPAQTRDILLSASAAKKLQAREGDTLLLRIQRKRDNRNERGQLQLHVSGILAPAAFPRPAALVSLDLLIDLERFRDGYRLPAFGIDSGDPVPATAPRFARARLYARSLEDVAPLADWLQQQNLDLSTRAHEIEAVQAIDRVLGLIFAVIAWTAVLGCAASLTGAFLANIDRKRRDLALLRLLGFRRSAAGSYVMLQSTLLTVLAFGLGYGLYALGARVFNQALGTSLTDGAFVCRLEIHHLMLAFAGALLIATLVAATGGYRALHIEPADSLRDI